jgi:hypothetical protein
LEKDLFIISHAAIEPIFYVLKSGEFIGWNKESKVIKQLDDLNFRPMKFTQISKIDLNIVLFEVLDLVEKEKLYSLVFENTTISFLDTEWKGFLKIEL